MGPIRQRPSLSHMLKLFALLAVLSAVFAQNAATAAVGAKLIDEFLEGNMALESLPCTPKPCVPVCKLVTKYLEFGAFKLPYSENVCEPDAACLSESAACVAKLQAAMQAAKAAEDDLTAKAKLKNDAQATSEQKTAAAEAKKVEAEAAATALASIKAAFEVSEKEAATAKAASVAAEAASTEKIAAMNAKLAEFESAKKSHLAAVAAYDGAKSEAAQALVAYEAAIKAHCDAEAVHAKAVTYIGHAHMVQSTCTESPTTHPTAMPTESPTPQPSYRPSLAPTHGHHRHHSHSPHRHHPHRHHRHTPYTQFPAGHGDRCSHSISEGECLAMAKRIYPHHRVDRRGGLVAGSWGHVPHGCSVQSRGDWAAHYNRGSGRNSGEYTLICFH